MIISRKIDLTLKVHAFGRLKIWKYTQVSHGYQMVIAQVEPRYQLKMPEDHVKQRSKPDDITTTI